MINYVLGSLLCTFLTFILPVKSQPLKNQGDLGNGKFINPILAGDFPDPTIVRDGTDYYLTTSSFDYAPGLTVMHSKDLVNWEPISYALDFYIGSVWAPDICKYNGKFYIYFTVANKGNFVVYADSPYGPWSNPIDLKVGWIDPCHVADESGQRWLFLSGGNRARLSADGLSVLPGTLERVYDGWKFPEEWITEGFALEGPKVKKIGQYYYMLSAEGGTSGPPTSHMITVARSKSINGPWENAPNNPLIHTYKATEKWWSKGHGSLIDTPDGKWWIIYHAYENGALNLGRFTLLEPLEFTKDGWLKTSPGVSSEKPIQKPIKSEKIINRFERLNNFNIGLDWKYYKNFDSLRCSAENGTLIMKAQGNSPHESAPLLFVAGNSSYEISVKIDKDSSAVAGLVLFYNADFYVGTGFDSKNRFRWRKGAVKGSASHTGGNELWLKIRNDNHIVTGYYSYNGIDWNKEIWGMDISGYNHNTLYDFMSILPGIFAYGNGTVKFSNFRFETLTH
jgi:beta-xylosidase